MIRTAPPWRCRDEACCITLMRLPGSGRLILRDDLPSIAPEWPNLMFLSAKHQMVQCIKTCPHHIFLMPNGNLAPFFPCYPLTDPLCRGTVPQVVACTRFDRGTCTGQRTSPRPEHAQVQGVFTPYSGMKRRKNPAVTTLLCNMFTVLSTLATSLAQSALPQSWLLGKQPCDKFTKNKKTWRLATFF